MEIEPTEAPIFDISQLEDLLDHHDEDLKAGRTARRRAAAEKHYNCVVLAVTFGRLANAVHSEDQESVQYEYDVAATLAAQERSLFSALARQCIEESLNNGLGIDFDCLLEGLCDSVLSYERTGINPPVPPRQLTAFTTFPGLFEETRFDTLIAIVDVYRDESIPEIFLTLAEELLRYIETKDQNLYQLSLRKARVLLQTMRANHLQLLSSNEGAMAVYSKLDKIVGDKDTQEQQPSQSYPGTKDIKPNPRYL